MADRPILRFPDPANAERHKSGPRKPPRPRGPGQQIQHRRFQSTFDRLADALNEPDPAFILRQDPTGIAPERALVFITAGRIQNFARAARRAGLEVFAESDLEAVEDFPDGFVLAPGRSTMSRTLYATMPTLESCRQIQSLWTAHGNREPAPAGAAPWWQLFDLMLELRPWGPGDRLSEEARVIIENRLPLEDDDEVPIEFEIMPTGNATNRERWCRETERRILERGGRVLDRSSISGDEFIYEALLAELPARSVRAMLDDPDDIEGLVTIEGVQFILPQTIGEAAPSDYEPDTAEYDSPTKFDAEAPIRAALLDGTPVAAHPALEGGLVIEDVHDLVRLSTVEERQHATEMASLILRGDLEADGVALSHARIVSVPLLIDNNVTVTSSPPDRLFVDLVHVALTKLFEDDEFSANNAFVVNFSIGVRDMRFAGRISSLARLMDWWAAKEGVLFVISAGNILENLVLKNVSASDFQDTDHDERCAIARDFLRDEAFNRTLLAPAECLNGIAVGALSLDLNDCRPPAQADITTLESETEVWPQMTSALGLGPHRAIKPDFLAVGGRQEVRMLPSDADTILSPLKESQRTGLVVAATTIEGHGRKKARGTSHAAALTTRAILQCAEALMAEDGPYEDQDLSRRDLALLTRALAINSARWPQDANRLYEKHLEHLGSSQHAWAKQEVCRLFGHGVLSTDLMLRSPESGVTLVGLGSIRKDQAQVFRLPLPVSLSGDRTPRSMRVTLAWFSPVDPVRAQYRLAALEAIAFDEDFEGKDPKWCLGLGSFGPDANMIKRGTAWSCRLINKTQRVPHFQDGDDIPIYVQCRDASGGGLNPDDDVDYAIAVTLEVEADVQYDIHYEVEANIRLRVRSPI